jgi:hypothetical protein
MIFAPDDMRNRHQMIVDHHRKVIGGHAVGTNNDKIPDGFALKLDRPPDQIIKFNGGLRYFKSIRRFSAGSHKRFALATSQVAAFAHVAGHALAQNKRLTFLFEFFFRAVTGIHQLRVNQLFQMIGIEMQPLALLVRTVRAVFFRPLIPGKPQPF